MISTKYYMYFNINKEKYLLINTLNGAIDVVEENVIKYLENYKNVNIDEKIILKLKERGYIVNDGDDSLLLNQLMDYHLAKNNTCTFIICPTYLCNLRCKYCFEDIAVRTQSKVMSKDDIDKVFEAINKICNSKNIKNAKILLFGGEPFLPSTKDIVHYIIEQSVNREYKISAISNGTNISIFSDDFYEFKNNFNNIQITLDGPREIHDKLRVKANNGSTFNQIVDNINLLLKIGIHVSLRINVGKNNVDFIPEILKLIDENKWNKLKNFNCQLAPITDHFCTGCLPNWMPESELLLKIYNLFDDFEEIKKKYKISLGMDMQKRTKLINSIFGDVCMKTMPNPSPCSAGGRTYYVFGPDGNIYPCTETVGNSKYSIGKFLPDLLINQENEEPWRRNVTNINKCSDCNIAPICGSGCTLSHILTNGINFDAPVCNYAHETVENYFKINKEKIISSLGDI